MKAEKPKKDSVRHTIIITLGEMAKKKAQAEDENDAENEAEGGEEEENMSGGDMGDAIVLRMIPKAKKLAKEKC